jgi:hypothetical protein
VCCPSLPSDERPDWSAFSARASSRLGDERRDGLRGEGAGEPYVGHRDRRPSCQVGARGRNIRGDRAPPRRARNEERNLLVAVAAVERHDGQCSVRRVQERHDLNRGRHVSDVHCAMRSAASYAMSTTPTVPSWSPWQTAQLIRPARAKTQSWKMRAFMRISVAAPRRARTSGAEPPTPPTLQGRRSTGTGRPGCAGRQLG